MRPTSLLRCALAAVLAAAGGAAITITSGCPSGTQPIGTPFAVVVTLPAPAGTIPHAVTAVATNWAFENTGGTCSASGAAAHGIASSNPVVVTATTTATFNFRPLSGCTGGTCRVRFTAPGQPDSADCTFALSADPPSSLDFNAAPQRCGLGACSIPLIARRSGNEQAIGATDPISLTFTSQPGLSITVGGSDVSGTTVAAAIAGGVHAIAATFAVTNAALWTQPYYLVNITATLGALPTVRASVQVWRPAIERVVLRDLIVANYDGTPANDAAANRVPAFEPTTSFPTHWNATSTDGGVVSTGAFPLAAAQYYAATVVGLDRFGGAVPAAFVAASDTVALQFNDTAATSGNAIYGAPATAADKDQYMGALTPVAFNAATGAASFVFRLRNAHGCADSDGCALNMVVPGRDTQGSYLRTKVRNTAMRFQVLCGAMVGGVATGLQNGTCPGSTVEGGVVVRISAYDADGNFDPGFNGMVYAGLDNTEGGRHPTTVASLVAGSTWGGARATNGYLELQDFTLSSVCKLCRVTFYSDWAVGYGTVTMAVGPSTTQLKCELSPAHTYYLKSVVGSNTVIQPYDAARQSELLVYPDTNLCFRITATNDAGVSTFSESAWVLSTVKPSVPTPITARPANGTALYGLMVNSTIDYCVNIDATNGAPFRMSFHAGDLGPSGLSCTTNEFRLTTKKFVGGLQLATVTTQATIMDGYAAPAKEVWAYRQLATVAETVRFDLLFHIFDHYGVRLAPADLDSSQLNYAVALGSCRSTQMDSNDCKQDTRPEQIKVDSHHSEKEGGRTRVAVVSSQHTLRSEQLALTLNVARWCVYCEVPFRIADNQRTFPDGVHNPIEAKLLLSFIMPDAGTTKYVVFADGTSPYKPATEDRVGYLGTYWPHYVPTAGAGRLPELANLDRPVLVHRTCISSPVGACGLVDRVYLNADPTGRPTKLTAKAGKPMQFFVVKSLVAPKFGETYCTQGGGNCYADDDSLQSQVDLLGAYTVTMAVGSATSPGPMAQKLACTSTSPCTGSGTVQVSNAITPLAGTLLEAVKLAKTKPLPGASFELTGADLSNFYTPDKDTGAVAALPFPTAGGVLSVGAAGATELTTQNIAGGSEGGEYRLVWRGPQYPRTLVVLAAAANDPSDATATYRVHQAPGTSAYTGYAAPQRLEGTGFQYAAAPVAVGEYFPITVELQDYNNKLAPGAKGTITVDLHSFSGCGTGGTVEVQGSATRQVTFANGRASIWVRFSAACSACKLQFTLVPDATQAALFAHMGPLVVTSAAMDVRPLQADTVMSVALPATAAAINVEDTVDIACRAMLKVGTLALPDSASTLTITAYRESSDAQAATMWESGNGGLLRSDSAATTSDRHALTVTVAGGATASLRVRFARTCLQCRILVAWSVRPTAGGAVTTGTFAVRHGSGDTFAVRAQTTAQAFFHAAPARLFAKQRPFSLAAWTAGTAVGIPFVGFTATAPAAATPALTAVDATNGDGGVLTAAWNTTATAVLYHFTASRSCDKCTLAVGGLSLDSRIHAVATHYRVTTLTPQQVGLGATLQLAFYASDDDAAMDKTIGAQTSCLYHAPLRCKDGEVTLSLKASQDGVRAGYFYPTLSFIHAGGPTAPGFAMTPAANFGVTDGRSPATSFTIGSSPMAQCYPMVVDSKGLSSAGHPTRYFEVDVGTDNLVLMNDRADGFEPALYEAAVFVVALTRQISGGTRYIVPNVDNTVRISFAGECQYDLLEDSMFKPLHDGRTNFTVRFKAPTVGLPCTVTFTSVAGSGTCATCVSTSPVTVKQPVATSWRYLRPTAMENDGPSAGPMYAAAGRAQIVQPQLYRVTPAATTVAQSCGGCHVSFFAITCTPTPTIVPAGAKAFNENGTHVFQMQWPIQRENLTEPTSRALPYSCAIAGSATNGLDPPPATSATVEICNPTQLRLELNHSSPAWQAGLVETGRSYELEVAMYDDRGALCRGDTQFNVSTALSADLVVVQGGEEYAVNINTSTAVVPGLPHPPFVAMNKAFLAGGRFRFRFVFSGPVAEARIRVNATSASPVLRQTLITPPFRVAFAAHTLAVRTPLAAAVSSGRRHVVEIIATDAMPRSWLDAKGRAPRVDDNATGTVTFSVRPSFGASPPVTFTAGGQTTALVNGVARVEFQFTQVGDFEIDIGTVWGTAASRRFTTLPDTMRVRVQTPTQLVFRSFPFRSSAPRLCATGCTLPEQGFTEHTVGSATVLRTNSTTAFDFSVFVADASGHVVLGEAGVNVSCRSIQAPGGDATGVTLAQAPSLVSVAPVTAAVAADTGFANFSLGFTFNGVRSGQVQLQCQCSSADCPTGLPSATSLPIEVNGHTVTTAMQALMEDTPIVKVPSTFSALNKFIVRDFQADLLQLLLERNIPYVGSDNIADVAQVQVCEVSRSAFGYSDLRTTVCHPGTCAVGNVSAGNVSGCPAFVRQCNCPSATDAFTGMLPAAAGIELQLEVALDLRAAPAFALIDEASIKTAYLALQGAVIDGITLDHRFLKYSILNDTVIATRSSAALLLPAAQQTPVPIQHASDSGGGTPTASAASAVSAAAVVAVVLALLGAA